MSYIPKRTSTKKKYKRIQDRFKELYHDQRLRRDDVIQQLMDEFYINQENTVWRILQTEV